MDCYCETVTVAVKKVNKRGDGPLSDGRSVDDGGAGGEGEEEKEQEEEEALSKKKDVTVENWVNDVFSSWSQPLKNRVVDALLDEGFGTCAQLAHILESEFKRVQEAAALKTSASALLWKRVQSLKTGDNPGAASALSQSPQASPTGGGSSAS
jgi:hypothetical protein